VHVQVTWTLFAVTWNLALCNIISVQLEETLYLICDFTAKVGKDSVLLIGKGNMCHRGVTMNGTYY